MGGWVGRWKGGLTSILSGGAPHSAPMYLWFGAVYWSLGRRGYFGVSNVALVYNRSQEIHKFILVSLFDPFFYSKFAGESAVWILSVNRLRGPRRHWKWPGSRVKAEHLVWGQAMTPDLMAGDSNGQFSSPGQDEYAALELGFGPVLGIYDTYTSSMGHSTIFTISGGQIKNHQ